MRNIQFLILNMRNLENYGVQQMNAKEMEKVDEGFIPSVIFGLSISVKALLAMVTCNEI